MDVQTGMHVPQCSSSVAKFDPFAGMLQRRDNWLHNGHLNSCWTLKKKKKKAVNRTNKQDLLLGVNRLKEYRMTGCLLNIYRVTRLNSDTHSPSVLRLLE